MKSVGLLCLALLLLYNISDAVVWYVHPDSTMNCIEDCLDSCFMGDTVLVGPGLYHENIVWPPTESITLMSEYGPDTTIIDGDSSYMGSVIWFMWGADTTTIIRGFTIRGGYPASFPGGGIYCGGSSLIIEDNIITMNIADDAGAGIMIVDASPVIRHNVISYNVSTYEGGGGIQIGLSPWQLSDHLQQGRHRNSSPQIINNTITHNTAQQGAGINCYLNTSNGTVIVGNTIADNTAEIGGGIFCFESSPAILSNTIIDNVATNEGGGIYCWVGSSPTIDSNSISNNSSGGIFCGHMSSPIIHYNNINDNIWYGVANMDSTITIDATNNWWGDATGPYHPTANPGGLGNLVSDYVDFIPWLTGPGFEEQPIVEPVEGSKTIHATIFRGPLQLPEGKKCKVYDITGRIVESTKIQPGIYFIEVDGVVTQKVVKVR